jgi:hypothetical protein
VTLAARFFNFSTLAACGLAIGSSAHAACKLDSSSLSPAALNAFVERPEAILNEGATTRQQARWLSILVSQYAATGPAAIAAITSILPLASPQQRTAIGDGLCAAVTFCRAIDPAVSTRIEKAIKSINDKEVMLAYRCTAGFSAPSSADSQPTLLSRAESAKTSVHNPDLLAERPLTGPWNLKIRDPFGPPDAWQ